MNRNANLPAAGIRALQSICARDHAEGQQHRRSAMIEQARRHPGRASRLSRRAALEHTRAAELLAEVS